MMRGMVIDMNDKQLHTLAQLRAFLERTVAVSFSVATNERYEFVTRTVWRFGYARLTRADKGAHRAVSVGRQQAPEAVHQHEHHEKYITY